MDPIYYICKLFDSWSLYDGTRKISRPLTKEELATLQLLFPNLIGDTGTLVAIQVTTVKAQKLMQLHTTTTSPPTATKTG
jgi:hypothetical protein